jgi:hypothetical protein
MIPGSDISPLQKFLNMFLELHIDSSNFYWDELRISSRWGLSPRMNSSIRRQTAYRTDMRLP